MGVIVAIERLAYQLRKVLVIIVLSAAWDDQATHVPTRATPQHLKHWLLQYSDARHRYTNVCYTLTLNILYW